LPHAILMAQHGVEVDLVGIKPDLAVLGSGITLQGNALQCDALLVLRPLEICLEVVGVHA
jgi:hypothetical protein